jgi:prepilin-type N-terminal cleavage/methylation domain-containing protein
MTARERRLPFGAGDDAGFSLIETIVAIALVGVVMASLSAFLVTSVSVTSQQSGRKGAIQAADDATELVRALKGSALLTGRDYNTVHTQWQAGMTGGLSSYLSTMAEAWDTTAATGSGATAPLPTTSKSVTLNGVTYGQSWYVGRCWQPTAGGDCAAATGDVGFFRVVVAVTWTEKHCPASACSYVATTLVSSAAGDPVFNANQNAVAPTVNNPGNQTGQAGVVVSQQVTASGGASPMTWTASGLPTGLSISTSGLISGTPTATGTFSVVVRVTDGFGLFGDAAFSWTISPPVQITTPSAQSDVIGVAVTALQVVASSGTTPYTWSATGLPPGLSIDSSGRIGGTPTTAGTYANVRVTVTDSATGTATTNAFTWTVAAALAVASPTSTLTGDDNDVISLQATASGGVSPYTWTASNLPTGLSINSSGRITGTLTRGTRWLTTLRVADARGGSASVTIPWVVDSSALAVTEPTGDRSDPRGTSINWVANATGTTTARSWSATGLPTGLGIQTNGRISGTLTTAGTYIVTLTVVRSGETAVFMFTWTVT